MRVKNLRLKNGYKRFRDLTIDLGENPARIIALVGPNGSGKSSVLDGMLFHQQAHEQLGGTGGRDPTYHSMDADASLNYQSVEINFAEGPYSHVREIRSQLGKPNTVFSFRSPYRYNSHIKISEIRSTTDIRQNNYGASDTSSLDSKMEDNYRRLQAMVNKYMQNMDVRPSEARSKIIGELNASIKKCISLEISNVGNVEAGKGTIYFRKSDHPKEFEFNVLSSGEKEVVDLLLDLYLRKDDYDDTIFMLDEPELHVNTAIQANLLSEIDNLIGDNCQIWITTHSIGFLRALQTQMKDKCQIIHFEGGLELAAKPYTLKPMKATAAAWRELFAVALADLAKLVSPETIIYCEGRGEPGKGGVERGMDARALNAIFVKSRPDSLFISSGGNTELDQRSSIAISILSKVFANVEVLVFKDRDVASGRIANEEDRRIYLENNPINHRVMKRFELENYLYDKSVLQAYCLNNKLEFDENAYDSLVYDINNQNLKDQTGKIKSVCGIKVSIDSDTFKIRLAECIDEDMEVFSELRDCIFFRS